MTEKIGDNLIASAVFPALKKRYDCLEVIARKGCHVVFENNAFVDKLSVVTDDDLPKGEGWQEWFRHRRNEYARFENLSQSCEMLLALTRGQTWYDWADEPRRKLCGKSYVEQVADICGVPYNECHPNFFPTEEEDCAAKEQKAECVGKRCIGWVISGSRYDKVYPFASVVIHRLTRELDIPVVIFGAPTPKDMEIARLIEGNLKIQGNRTLRNFHIAISESWTKENWPIRRVLTQVQHCDLVVGPDTGPMWAVADRMTPKVMLLSHASPENITKGWRNTVTLHADQKNVPCWPCHKLIDGVEYCVENEWKSGAACISDINPDQVVEAVLRSWPKVEAEPVKDGPSALEQIPEFAPLVIRTNGANGADREITRL